MEGKVGSVWQVTTPRLTLLDKQNFIRLRQDDLTLVLHENEVKSFLLTRSDVIQVFKTWCEYCVRVYGT